MGYPSELSRALRSEMAGLASEPWRWRTWYWGNWIASPVFSMPEAMTPDCSWRGRGFQGASARHDDRWRLQVRRIALRRTPATTMKRVLDSDA